MIVSCVRVSLEDANRNCVIVSAEHAHVCMQVHRFWQSAIATLRVLASTYPDNTPPGVVLDRNILGWG